MHFAGQSKATKFFSAKFQEIQGNFIDKNEIPFNRVATRPKITLVEDGKQLLYQSIGIL